MYFYCKLRRRDSSALKENTIKNYDVEEEKLKKKTKEKKDRKWDMYILANGSQNLAVDVGLRIMEKQKL